MTITITYLKITNPACPSGDHIWYAKAPRNSDITPEEHIANLNRYAALHAVAAKYELATADEYHTYKAQLIAYLKANPNA